MKNFSEPKEPQGNSCNSWPIDNLTVPKKKKNQNRKFSKMTEKAEKTWELGTLLKIAAHLKTETIQHYLCE